MRKGYFMQQINRIFPGQPAAGSANIKRCVFFKAPGIAPMNCDPAPRAMADACMKYKRHIALLTRKYPDRLPGHGFPILRDSDILIFLNDNPGVSRL